MIKTKLLIKTQDHGTQIKLKLGYKFHCMSI